MKSADLRLMLQERVFVKGTTNIFTGHRGYGKTFTCMSLAKMMVDPEFSINHEQKRYAVIGNVLFYSWNKDIKKMKEAYPDGYYYCDTMKDLFKITSQIMIEDVEAGYSEDEWRTIIVMLDEAHLFFNAYRGMAELPYNILRYMGIARKYQHSTQFMLPHINMLPTQFRDFEAYLNTRWDKPLDLCDKYAMTYGRDKREVIFMEIPGYTREGFFVPPTEWTPLKPREGQLVYSGATPAIYSLGFCGGHYNEKTGAWVPHLFDFSEFLVETARNLPHNMGYAIRDYLEGAGDEEEKELVVTEDMLLKILFSRGLSPRNRNVQLVEIIEGMTERTIYNKYNSWKKAKVVPVL